MLVMDIESGEVLHIVRGKVAAVLKGFWWRLALCGAWILVLGYMATVEE